MPSPTRLQAAMRRPLLRLPVLFALALAAYLGAILGFQLAAKRAPESLAHAATAALGLALGAMLIFAYRLAIRTFEGREPAELHLAGAERPLAAGAALGAALFATVYAVLGALGHLTYLGRGDAGALAAALASSILAAVGEEILMRGVLFRVLEEGFGTLVAILLSGGLFGLLHHGNPGADLTSSVAIALEAGILLGVAYAATRTLWLPIGLHFGWNFTEGGVFGAAVSGSEARGLLRFSIGGSDLVSGGAFGPEASIVAVAVCLAAAAGFVALIARRGRWQPLRFRMRVD